MPYDDKNDPNIPKNVPDADKAQWVKIWNSTFAECMKEDGAKKDTCETKAFTYANGVIKKDTKESVSPKAMKNLRETVRNFFRQIGKIFVDEDYNDILKIEQAFSMPTLYDLVWNAIDKMSASKGTWIWLVDVYMEESKLFAVMAMNGMLYRSDIAIDDKWIVTLSEMIQIIPKFEPITNTGVQMMRQSDGRTRVFLVSGTSVVNRNGFIDSRSLFDNMAKRAKESEEKPYIDFFHLGKDFYMGNIDFMDRDGNVGIASGLLEDNELTHAWIAAYDKDPEFWGSSLSFFPTGAPTKVEVAEDISIKVYSDGICNAIAILPEKDACAVYTAVTANRTEINRMDKRVEDALRLLAGEDQELMNAFVAKIDGINQTIAESGAVTQAEETPALASEELPVSEPSTEPEPTPAPEPVLEPQTVELNAEAITQIGAMILESPAFVEFMSNINEAILSTNASILQIGNALASVQVDVATADARTKAQADEIAVLKVSEEEKKRAWQKDLPAATRGAGATFRPKVVNAEVDKSKRLDSVAEATLANMK